MDKKQEGAVTTLTFDMEGGWEQWFLLMSDNHHDSITCNRELESEHLEEAKKRNARILIFGDFFDAMQGRFDPRRNLDELRPEYRCSNYYDVIIEDATQFLLPYKDNIDLLGWGNHEYSVLQAANTNLTDRLAGMLNSKGANVMHGGFGGWVRFMFQRNGVSQGSYRLKYNHTSGGESASTRGISEVNKQASYIPDADFIVNGHNHQSYYVPVIRERINNKGVLFFDVQHHIRIPGYMQGYGDGSRGFAVMSGHTPKPNGCAWIRLSLKQTHAKKEVDVQVISDVKSPNLISVPM